jgi:dihydrofolate synthase/folylpolyglutamate synthase
MTVGLAFQYFAEEKVDIAIIEVGLGGRLDSTNVITPLVSVITNISFDHTALLGDTLEKIAAEKAGIIKKNIPVVIGESIPETRKVFADKAEKENAELFFAEDLFDVQKLEQENGLLKLELHKKDHSSIQIESPLQGTYQRKNIVTVLSVMEVLKEKGLNVPETVIQKGIRNVIGNTGLAGRWQILGKDPLVIADTGHNEAGISEVLQQIKQVNFQKLHFVLGMVNDKDISKILSMLPVEAEYYFCKANIPRALDAEELSLQANKNGLKGSIYPSVPAALEAAVQKAHKDDLVFVGGSTFTVAEVV